MALRTEDSKHKIAKFQRAVRAALKPRADAKRAAGMRAYMRGRFEYLGITTPERRAAIAPLIRAFKPATAGELREAAEVLWAMREREYQYVAADLLIRYQSALSLDDLPGLLDLAQQKSWWDTVDCIVKVVGKIVRRSGAKGVRAMDRAVKHKDFWVRRIAMLHQLGSRDACDTERLFRYAEQLATEKEFFIRKAIGWALRDYAWHDVRAVENFLKSTSAQLSGLTVREARKNFAALNKSSRKTP
ncbi:MAG TPA: DNA alkylation repair protein [Terracidiphilus sp.]|nr:DNA alkylation repair protein [Terracidiphilus sp.]